MVTQLDEKTSAPTTRTKSVRPTTASGSVPPATDPKKNRRGPDLRMKMVRMLGVVCWLLTIIGIWLFDAARPETSTLLDKRWNSPVREHWNLDLAELAFAFAVGNLVLCVLGLGINATRHRREDDRYSRSLLFNGGASFVGILVYLLMV